MNFVKKFLKYLCILLVGGVFMLLCYFIFLFSMYSKDQNNAWRYDIRNIVCIRLCNAAAKGDIEIIKYYIEKDNKYANTIDLNSAESILTIAIINRHYDICRYLLRKGAIGDKKDIIHGFSAIYYAVQNNDLYAVQLLLKYNANVNDVSSLSSNRITPIFIAINNNNKELLIALINAHANINHQNIYGQTPIYYAIKNHSLINILV